MSRVRKVYNLRKTSNVRATNQPEQSRVSNARQQSENNLHLSDYGERNISLISQNIKDPFNKIQEQLSEQHQIEGEELVVDKLQLNFDVRLADIERKEIKIKNIGNSAVYLQFAFKNTPKINSSGFKDTKLKFYCHYENNVIKPGEEQTFIFSFLSEFPGNFTQDVEIICQPPLKTKIPNIKLCGKAFILDQLEDKRSKFHKDIQQEILKEEIRQILSDVIDLVKLPPPPKPDVSNPKIAERQFQKNNSHLNLFYNQHVHRWFDQVFIQVCQKGSVPEINRYWDQSVQTLKQLINTSDFLDDVDKKCYLDRIQHYCYLSVSPLPNKSEIYSTVYEFMSNAAYHLGGEYVDSARKELDMWEIPFRQPLEHDSPQDIKLRKEEVEKIKSEWVKKAKKKKWGAQQQAELVNQFKKKVQIKTTENILNRFDHFQQRAQFIKAKQFLSKSTFSLSRYQNFLQRMKTVKEYPVEGKKVMIKWNLKLKQNCQDKLKELEEYLGKKQQEEKRLEQQKKNEGNKKKKAPIKPKKKGQKQQEEQKPLFFDFMSLLDEQNWNGFTETFRIVAQKQPFLTYIGITYGPRSGRYLSKYSVYFLLEHLKTLQPSIQFFPHQNLPSLNERIQTQSINQGSIFLLQNLNFLPYETTQEETTNTLQDNCTIISKRKLLHPQIRNFFDQIGQSIDVVINQDRYLAETSGFSAYLNKEVVLGTQWWKYVGLSIRINGATVVFGEDFTPQNYVLLTRLVETCQKIYLVGLSGLKFYLVKNKLDSLGNIALTISEKQTILYFLSLLESQQILSKIVIPQDFILSKEGSDPLIYNGRQGDIDGYIVKDIGPLTINAINQIQLGNLFLLGQTSIVRNQSVLSDSLIAIIKDLSKKQEGKRQRHQLESGHPLGINYNQDLVVYLIGISQALIEKIQLRDKKQVRIAEEQSQQAGEEDQPGQSDKKKIDLISDFHLSSLSCMYRLWRGEFDVGLKDISQYQQISD